MMRGRGVGRIADDNNDIIYFAIIFHKDVVVAVVAVVVIFTLKPFLLPNDVSTPSVCPDSSP